MSKQSFPTETTFTPASMPAEICVPIAEDRNTILAALRFWQSHGMGDPSNRSDVMHALATNDDQECSYNDQDIDDLCIRINTYQCECMLPVKLNKEAQSGRGQ